MPSMCIRKRSPDGFQCEEIWACARGRSKTLEPIRGGIDHTFLRGDRTPKADSSFNQSSRIRDVVAAIDAKCCIVDETRPPRMPEPAVAGTLRRNIVG
jgi:hypothetical protein